MKPEANWDACIQMVEEMMQISNPLMLRRLKINEMKPTEGENPRSYIIRSKITFNEAEYEQMTSDDHKVLHIIVAMSDPEVNTNLLKLAEPRTLAKVKTYVNTFEKAKATSSSMNAPGDAARSTYYNRGGKGGQRGGNRGKPRGRRGSNYTPAAPGKKRVIYCIACNKPNYLAIDCRGADRLV